MKTTLAILALTLITFATSSCTDNTMAKSFGGNMDINLPTNTKLVNVTWKESELWYLTRPMHADETAETFTFHEKSSFGMLQGTVTFHETK